MAKKKVTRLSNLIIIDASGSMASKIDEVRGGLKQLLSQIEADAKRDKKTTLSETIVIDFSGSGDFRTLLHSRDSLILDKTSAETYTTRGMTALYDAINKGFGLVSSEVDSVFVNIITDGQENDSKECTSDTIKFLIKEKKGKNWAITFMGTTEADINKAVSLGIDRGNTASFTNSKDGVLKAMKKSLNVRSAYYATNSNFASLDFAEQENVRSNNSTLMDDTKDNE